MNCKAAPIESVISDTDRSSIFFFQKNKGLAARFRRASYFFINWAWKLAIAEKHAVSLQLVLIQVLKKVMRKINDAIY